MDVPRGRAFPQDHVASQGPGRTRTHLLILDIVFLAHICEGAGSFGGRISAEHVRLSFKIEAIGVKFPAPFGNVSSPGYCHYYAKEGPLASY